MYKATETAAGKINLFLEVTGKRNDGYHNIESVMTSVSLSDTVTVEKKEEKGILLDCIFDRVADFSQLYSLSEKENLAYKAAQLFISEWEKAYLPLDTGIKITIDKKIPVCAGLAGGSTDAAATLRAMNSLFGMPFDKEKLCQMGAKLGADVPFCIVGGTCLCRGIGDILEKIDTELCFHGLISVGKLKKVSTGAAYSMIDALPGRELKRADRTVSALINNDFSSVIYNLYNIFELACDYGGVATDIMKRSGAAGALMSGAGPSVFGLFQDDNMKYSAKTILENEGFSVYNF